MPLAVAMARLRSSRSTSAPPGKPNSSHGRNANVVSPETSSVSLVSDAASKGSVTLTIPSARVAVADAVNNFQNERSSAGAEFVARYGAPKQNRFHLRKRNVVSAQVPVGLLTARKRMTRHMSMVTASNQVQAGQRREHSNAGRQGPLSFVTVADLRALWMDGSWGR